MQPRSRSPRPLRRSVTRDPEAESAAALQVLARQLAQERANVFTVALGGLEAIIEEAGQGNGAAQDALRRFRRALESLLD